MNKAETVRIAKLGKKELRLVKQGMRYFGMADGQRCSESENADTAWQQLHENAGKSDPKYFGLGEARIRFLKFFPNGFHSDGYAEQERNYKVAAKVKLDEAVPPEMAVAGVGLGEDILGVFRATNLLSPFEKTRLQDLLRGSYADAFVQAVARFALSPDASSLFQMEQILRQYESAKWTVATYLPFLWFPESHMFLKPEVTREFAVRVGHPFSSIYESRLHFPVYESLLDLAEKVELSLKDMSPRDRIDIQSFIWTVGDYQESREGVYL